ncbi:DsbA family protein [Allopontixanthobacter sp.]|uniref:DsbA family protein n=1 Tax=Allopontixanthobacter sp. TaxID=2906452 RepID=UPI002ABC8409|nr:thioredoxin domain-containing protein [Allopontixanthobacter sp.]MDZ4307933.1 thioredoxin domain-containing protein [Allopontixanthobacter sp.]
MFRKSAALGLAALAMIAASGAHAESASYINQVRVTDGGHQIGNPDAKLAVQEFVSYTCPACANYTRFHHGALELAYVSTGDVTLEIRHIIRDPIDLTAVMLTHCGAASKFPQNHKAMMLGQDKWLPRAQSATAAQRSRWATGTGASRRRAIASDMGFYAMMESRGYRRTDIDRCLADEAKAAALAEASEANGAKYFVSSTPSFAINGVTLAGTHSWNLLEPQIRARLP